MKKNIITVMMIVFTTCTIAENNPFNLKENLQKIDENQKKLLLVLKEFHKSISKNQTENSLNSRVIKRDQKEKTLEAEINQIKEQNKKLIAERKKSIMIQKILEKNQIKLKKLIQKAKRNIKILIKRELLLREAQKSKIAQEQAKLIKLKREKKGLEIKLQEAITLTESLINSKKIKNVNKKEETKEAINEYLEAVQRVK